MSEAHSRPARLPRAPVAHLFDRIRFARRASELTQAVLAARVGVSASAVAQWERRGGSAPSTANLAQIAMVTGVSIEWLTTGRGSIHAPGYGETPTVVPEIFALDLFEERLLVAFRTVPRRRREIAAHMIEDITRRLQTL